MAARRQYTEEDRAVALAAYAANENNLERTAKFCGIARNTLRRWVNGEVVNAPTVALATVKKDQIADECERLAWKLLAGIDDEEKIAGTPVNLLSVAFGTMIDKMRLLRGESTQTVDVNDQRAALHEKWIAFVAPAAANAVSQQPDGD